MVRQSKQFNDVVTFLREIGYATAEVKFEKDNPEQCEPRYLLAFMASVASEAASPSKTQASVSTAISALACESSWLYPHWTWTPVPAPAWGPPPPPPPAYGPGWSPPRMLPPLLPSTLINCVYTADVTQKRTRTRMRYYPGIGTATCVETQTRTCTYTVTCPNDAGGPNGGCPTQPSCATTPTVSCSDGAWSSCW